LWSVLAEIYAPVPPYLIQEEFEFPLIFHLLHESLHLCQKLWEVVKCIAAKAPAFLFRIFF
jgi:hypothetical protein